MGELDMDIRSQPPHVSTEEYRVTEHVMETMKQEMPTIVRSMVNFIIYSNYTTILTIQTIQGLLYYNFLPSI